MVGMITAFLAVSNLFLIFNPLHNGLRVELKVLTRLIQILPSRIVKFYYLQFSLSGVAVSSLLVGGLAVQGSLQNARSLCSCHLESS